MIRSFRHELGTWKEQDFLRPAIVLVAISLSAVLGQDANLQKLQQVGLIAAGILGFLIVIRSMEAGLAGLMIASFLIKWEISTGTKIPINATTLIAALLVVVWIANMAILQRNVWLAGLRVNRLALVFCAAATVSLLAGINNIFPQIEERASLPAQLGGWGLYVLSFGMFLFVGSQVRDLSQLKKLTWLFLALGGVYLIFRLFPPLFDYRGRLFVHPQSFGSVFWIWLVALAAGQFLFNTDLPLRGRLAALALVVAALYASLFQTRAWISGWLPPLVALWILLWLRSWRLGAAITLVGGLAIFVYYAALNSTIYNPVEQYSISSRWATYPIMLDLIKISPLVGLGPANYYYYTRLFPLLGWYVKFNSHNNYMDILAQTGLIGLTVFTWFAVEIGRLGGRVRAKFMNDRPGSGFPRGYTSAALAALAATLLSGLLGDWFLPFLYNVGFRGFRASIFAWIFLGGLVTLARMDPQK